MDEGEDWEWFGWSFQDNVRSELCMLIRLQIW